MWLLLQLADSAFPTGGFAHSAGLEAAVQLGEVTTGADLDRFARASAWQAGLGALPLVGGAHSDPAAFVALDRLCDAFLTQAVPNRASRTQGRAFVATCARVFPSNEAIARVDARARDGDVAAHLAPTFGGTLRALGVSRADAFALYLHLTLRGVLSAAVRLGVVGPHEAQRIQRELGPLQDEVRAACIDLPPEAITQTAPGFELLGASQDRLYSTLFQS